MVLRRYVACVGNYWVCFSFCGEIGNTTDQFDKLLMRSGGYRISAIPIAAA